MCTDEAYLKQRRHLNPAVFKKINEIYLKDFYEEKRYIQRKNGYILFAIDGSKEEIPNTQKNREEFGYTENKEGINVARALLSSIYDINNHFYVDVEIDKYSASEIELAKRNIEKMIEIIGKEKILIIFDRNYPSIEFFYWLEKRNIKFLMRLRGKDYKEEKFVRVLEEDVCPQTKWVEGSNYVDIGFKIDPRTNRIIMMGAIDNLVKGAAGQAVQNMNLMFGLKESEGLELVPMFP